MQSYLLFIALAVIVILGVFIARSFFSDNHRYKQLLQSTSPQPLINHYNELLGKAPEVHLAFPKALAHTLYGNFDAAKLEIDRIEYQQKPLPPIFQAQKVYLQAVWAYLEKHDFQQGRDLAKEARHLAEAPSALPNSFISLSAFDAASEMGELLNGNSDPNLLARLQKRLIGLSFPIRILTAWGLERIYNQSGEIQKAQEMRSLMTKFGPHCKGLSGD